MLLHTNLPFPTLFSFFIYLALMLYTMRFRNAPGASYFIFAMLLNAMLAITSVWELQAVELSTKLMWRNIEQIPLFMGALSFYGLVMVLTGWDERKVRKQLFWLGLPIAVYLLLIFTDSYHHLMRSHIDIEPYASYTRIQLQSTSLSLLFIAYGRIVGVIAILRLLYCLRTVSRYNRTQYVLIILSAVIPLIISLLSQLWELEISISVSSVPGGLLLCLAVLHYKLLRVRPMAKDTIIEHMKEGVVVLDTDGVILDMNPSSMKIFGQLGSNPYARKHLGKNIRFILEDQPELLQHYEQAEGAAREFQFHASPFHYSVNLIPIQLRSRRIGTLFIFTDISERIAYETELLRRANVDGLTKVYNRQYIIEATTLFMDKNQPLSFMLIDIDYFKAINDQYGHQTGDRALTEVAAIINETVGALGITGRMGGEEFGVSLPGVGLQEALALAELIRANVERAAITEESAGAPLHCTISIGVSAVKSSQSTFAEMYQQADDGLYQSKRNGRNQVTMV